MEYTLPKTHGRRPNIIIVLFLGVLLVVTINFTVLPMMQNAKPPDITLRDMHVQAKGLHKGARFALQESMKASWMKLLNHLMAKVKSGKVLSAIEIALLQQIMDVIMSYEWSEEMIGWIEMIMDMMRNILTQNAINEMQLQNG